MDFEGSGEVAVEKEEEEEGGFADIQRLMRVFSILKILRVIKIARHSTGIQVFGCHALSTKLTNIGFIICKVKVITRIKSFLSQLRSL